LSKISKFVRVYIPRKNVLSPLAIKNLKNI
jgi:hypothetical protein